MFVSEIKVFDRDVSTKFGIKDAKHIIHRRDKHEGRKGWLNIYGLIGWFIYLKNIGIDGLLVCIDYS